MRFLVIIGGYLLALLKGVSAFFLSGGGVVFIAVSLFTGFVAKSAQIFYNNSSKVAEWIDKLTDIITKFHDLNVEGFSQVVVYATAVDTLITDLVSFTSVFLGLLGLVCFGLLSFAFAIAVPLVVFKVLYFLKKQISSI